MDNNYKEITKKLKFKLLLRNLQIIMTLNDLADYRQCVKDTFHFHYSGVVNRSV